MRKIPFPIVCLVLLAGCKSSSNTDAQDIIAKVDPGHAGVAEAAPQNKFGFREAVQPGPDLFGSDMVSARTLATSMEVRKPEPPESRSPTPSAAPVQQIAYSYGFGFQIGHDKIAALQRSHTAMCEAVAPKCRVMRTSQASNDGVDGYGEVQLQVAATEVGDFEKKLVDPAEKLGGELISSVRDGEDLSENIVDAQAHLQSRLILRDKLTAILQGNRGTVADLIEAEKAVADVNGEIDEYRSKLELFRNRIQYSYVKIEYQPYFGQTQLGFVRPIMAAVRSTRTTLGYSIAGLLYAITALVPFVLFVLALRWLLHRFGLRIRFWQGKVNASAKAGLQSRDTVPAEPGEG